jgi:hypothetical protein
LFSSSQNAQPKDFTNEICPVAANIWLKNSAKFDLMYVLCMPKPSFGSANFNRFANGCTQRCALAGL